MSTITPPSPSISRPSGPSGIEPDDLLAMEGLFELVDGSLLEKQISFAAGDTATTVITLIQPFAKKNGLGKLVPEISFRCFPQKAKQVRRPDLAFIAARE